MKFKKDVALALATMAGALVALFTLFVTIPVWFEAVVVTLTLVGFVATISEIVKAHKASYDEELGVRTYRFPVRVFILGTLFLVATAATILLCLKGLFGFALIPVTVALVVLFVVAYLKKLRTMKWIVGLLIAILVITLVGYFTSFIVHNGVNLNPGISAEITVPETETPETEAPETETPETETPETETPEIETPETETPEIETPETETPEIETPETETPETETPETETPETETPETEAPETETPETETPEIETPETETPETETPETEVPETETPEIETPETETPEPEAPETETPETETPEPETPETETPEPETPETETPETEAPETETPETEAPETETPEIETPETETPEPEAPETETPETEAPETEAPETETPEPEIKDEEEENPTPEIPEVVKINAPATIYYAEPITITLEGCTAENLRFGNEAFLSIVIVSDSEVEITLIGIVNESGEVEFVPASGYITVTDSVSGEHVTIEIAEREEADPIIPEVKDPEIKDEDEVVEDKPVVDVEKPDVETEPEEEYTPVVVRINAPKTMIYAEPITITLEGIKAANLKFSNEDFLSIVVISDTEVEITLVGIVNDAGEVELIPAAGYITITDSVSGVHTIIEIVG